jgi:molybdopterin-guanine dinucleotide biosynthesis protein A
MNLSAVILAGGESRRMGRDKAWVKLGGRTLLELAGEKVRRLGVKELFISGRPEGDYSALKCPVLFDLEPGLGPLGGIERALHAASSPLVLVLAVDLPRMTTAFLRKLVAGCNRLTGVVPRLNDRLEPLVAIYPPRCRLLAFDAIARSRYAVNDFAKACLRERAVRIRAVAPADAGCFANWNQPADIAPAAAQARLRSLRKAPTSRTSR